jgi:hypothetical protein
MPIAHTDQSTVDIRSVGDGCASARLAEGLGEVKGRLTCSIAVAIGGIIRAGSCLPKRAPIIVSTGNGTRDFTDAASQDSYRAAADLKNASILAIFEGRAG